MELSFQPDRLAIKSSDSLLVDRPADYLSQRIWSTRYCMNDDSSWRSTRSVDFDLKLAEKIRTFLGQDGNGALFTATLVGWSSKCAIIHTNGTEAAVTLRWFEFNGKIVCLANWSVAWKNEAVERSCFVMLQGDPTTYGPFDHFIIPEECEYFYR